MYEADGYAHLVVCVFGVASALEFDECIAARWFGSLSARVLSVCDKIGAASKRDEV
jgi:hypothetical protein